MKGRKPRREFRAAEFRARLVEWKQTPSRPSLRALARQLGTSHQLLCHYLSTWGKWESKKYRCRAREIRARAKAEARPITRWEEQLIHAHDRAAIRAMVIPAFIDAIERIKQDAKRGPLHRAQFKMLGIFATQGIPGARELLQKCAQDGLKERKRFADIVKETPRQEGEACVAWVRRIWDQCAKYDTKCPAVITEELLQKCSQGSAKKQKNNLPAISPGAAKSFGSVLG